ncbi:unnamed protein product [Brassica oleracea]
MWTRAVISGRWPDSVHHNGEGGTCMGHPLMRTKRKTPQCDSVEDSMRENLQFLPASSESEPEVMPAKRGRGRPRKENPKPGMEWVPVPPLGEPPNKKRGSPRKSSVPYEDTSDGSPETCRCDVLVLKVQKPHTVVDYLEEFLDTAKRCKPKPAEEWWRLKNCTPRNHKLKSLSPISLAKSSSLHLHLSSVVFAGPHMSHRTLYRRILLSLTAVTPHFLASPSDLPSPPLVTEKQQFLERFDFTNSSSRGQSSFDEFCPIW